MSRFSKAKTNRLMLGFKLLMRLIYYLMSSSSENFKMQILLACELTRVWEYIFEYRSCNPDLHSAFFCMVRSPNM